MDWYNPVSVLKILKPDSVPLSGPFEATGFSKALATNEVPLHQEAGEPNLDAAATEVMEVS